MSSAENESQVKGGPAAGDPEEPAASRWRIEVGGRIDRHRAEILFLELRRLAARHAGAVTAFTIRKE